VKDILHRLDRIGVQLHTVKDEMKKNVAKTLEQVSSIGYTEVEFAGYFGHSPREIKILLERNHLTAPSTHVSFADMKNSLQEIFAAAKEIGHQYIILSSFYPEIPKTLDDVHRLADFLNHTGKLCNEEGLQFGFHNHATEFQRIDGKLPFDILLNETDPKFVVVQIDTYWVVYAHHDPVVYFRKFPGRFSLLHLKDIDNSPDRNSTEIGNGTIDWKSLLAEAVASGTKHFFVEQEHFTQSTMQSVRVSFDYLRTLNFS